MEARTSDGQTPLRDPWWLQRWARGQRTGDPTRKLILSVLAETADSEHATCHPSQQTLAEWCEVGERTVRGHLGALEEAGLIARRKRFREGGARTSDSILLRAPGVDEWPDGQPVTTGSRRPPAESAGGSPSPGNGQSSTTALTDGPEERIEEKGRKAAVAGASDSVPDGFPDELRPHARLVLPVLREVAAQHNARKVTALALGRTMMEPSRRRKPFVKLAHDFASWAADPPRPIRDVVASYRTWLDRERDLQAVERLPGGGAVEATGPRRGRFDRKVTRDG